MVRSRHPVVAVATDWCHPWIRPGAFIAPLRCTPSWMSGTPQGPAMKRLLAACPSGASEHRDGANAAGLQLAGNGLRRAQGHEAWLEHWATATADMHRDARLRGGLEHTRIDVHHHLTDRAAGSGGGHGWLARNTDPSPCRNHPDQGVAVRAFLGRGSPCPWLDPGCVASGPGVVLIRGDCKVPGNGIRRAVLDRLLNAPQPGPCLLALQAAADGADGTVDRRPDPWNPVSSGPPVALFLTTAAITVQRLPTPAGQAPRGRHRRGSPRLGHWPQSTRTAAWGPSTIC